VPLNRALIGREYPISEPYEVSREKIRDFAIAIGDMNPAYHDVEAAKALGHPDVIAPPSWLFNLSFRFVFPSPAVDPELGLNYALVVHGEQSFVHHRPVHAGEWITWQTKLTNIEDKGRNELMTYEGAVKTTEGELVAVSTSVIVSRGTAAPKEG
jgi:acyl dehydratase